MFINFIIFLFNVKVQLCVTIRSESDTTCSWTFLEVLDIRKNALQIWYVDIFVCGNCMHDSCSIYLLYCEINILNLNKETWILWFQMSIGNAFCFKFQTAFDISLIYNNNVHFFSTKYYTREFNLSFIFFLFYMCEE